MEKQIANILFEVAQHLLLLFCLTSTYIKCDMEGSSSPLKGFALVEYSRTGITDNQHDLIQNDCGAVWISRKSVLTAASCFDRKGVFQDRPGEDLLKDLEELQVLSTYMDDYLMGAGERWKVFTDQYRRSDLELDGLEGTQVIIHPLYKRKGDMTIAFDLAVVNVDTSQFEPKNFKNFYPIANLCTQEKIKPKKWVAIAVAPAFGLVLASEFHPHSPAFYGYVNITERGHGNQDVLIVKDPLTYFIDPAKQFTMYHTSDEARKQQEAAELIFVFDSIMHEDKWIGGPVFANEIECVAGIMSFGAVKYDKQRSEERRYITSTRVEPAIHWINYVLKNTISDLQKNNHSFWEEKLGKEKLGSLPQVNSKSPEKSPGNPVSAEERARQGITDPPMPTQSTKASKKTKQPKKTKPRKSSKNSAAGSSG